MNVLLLSTYELGHQPLALARPAAHLRAAGHAARCIDLAVDSLDEAAVGWAELIAISAPMHTATRLGRRLAERVRALNPRAHVCFYGLYASLNAESLLGRHADSVIGGEFETPLVELADRLSGKYPATGGVDSVAGDGVMTRDGGGVYLGRQQLLVPARELLPPLDRYARLDDGSRLRLAGYVEASRGCAHRCLHCPITPVYGGRLRIAAQEVVLEDIRRQVAAGAEHITFGDPDFFNGVRHSLRIVEAMHAEFPELTYDVTIKIEHLLEHRALLPSLKRTGCRFIVSAVESLDDRVLANLRKGHTGADVELALGLVEAAGLVCRPTFIPFTPWSSLESYLALLEFVERRGLIRHVAPIQLTIRLLVPRGSSLVGTPPMDNVLGEFDDGSLAYTWEHPDSRMDALQREAAAAAEGAARAGEDPAETFVRIWKLAFEADGRRSADLAPAVLVGGGPVPRLTEPWFC